MPHARGGRQARRIIWGMVLASLTVSLVGLVPTTSYASGDDYPYAGLGQCPLVPLPPKPPKPPKPHGTLEHPGKPGGPAKPGGPGQPGGPGKPGGPGQVGTPHQQTQPAQPDTPPPPRQCAKHIWFYNGSYGDPWGFALRNCTSFVAWRLRTTNGLADFENHFGGVHWGNAADWDEAATDLGYLADDVPAVGAVAQTDDGRHGHVAWVSAVGEGTVTVEEYNYGIAGGYDVRTVPTSSFRYLHLDDVSPAPYLGSTRAGVATTDAHNGSWSAHTTADGRLVVRRPSGRTTPLRSLGGWSGQAAPSVVTDAQGRVWIAATSAGGRVLVAHTSPSSTAFTRPHPLLPGVATSSPALLLDGQGRVRLLALTGTGTLLERHTPGPRSDRWSRAHRLGPAGVWSTHAAPVATADTAGRIWVAAVTRHGTLETQHTVRHGGTWSGFRAVDRQSWSVTSSPALTDDPDGRVWLAGVARRGDLVVRHTSQGSTHWQRGHWMGGLWSPYSSPSMAVDRNGRTWLAAVDVHGRLTVSSTTSEGRVWHRSAGVPRGTRSEQLSPVLATTVDGVLVGTTDRHGRAVWRRPVGPSGSLSLGHGARGGGFSISRFL
jgi:surface antigen